jgi:IS5 family transposase
LLHGNETRVRAKVDHVFGVIKNIFGIRKARHRGPARNLHRMKATAALANL